MWPAVVTGALWFAGPFGIDVGYYTHLARGQWHLIWNQTPIDRLVASEDVDPRTREA